VAAHGVVALDLGGVLLTDGTKTAFSRLRSLGLQPREAKELWHGHLRMPAELGAISSDEVFARLAALSPHATPAAVRSVLLDEFRPIPYGIDYLRRTSAGGGRVALATNHLHEWLAVWRDRFEWFSLLDPVVCSSSIGARKPDMPFFDKLVAEVGGERGFGFVDDDRSNVDAAAAAGLRGVLARGDWAADLPAMS